MSPKTEIGAMPAKLMRQGRKPLGGVR
jgi:hypothetical protein